VWVVPEEDDPAVAVMPQMPVVPEASQVVVVEQPMELDIQVPRAQELLMVPTECELNKILEEEEVVEQVEQAMTKMVVLDLTKVLKWAPVWEAVEYLQAEEVVVL
jgi:hypothetical protein